MSASRPFPPVPMSLAVETCQEMLNKGSKSFSLAAKIFDRSTYQAVCLLYGWCRYCDDAIDLAAQTEKPQALPDALDTLKEKTRAAYGHTPCTDTVFLALQAVVHTYQIPSHYPMELLEGLAMDVQHIPYPTAKTLELYCYRVAGTVGLMMCHIMGLRDEKALRNACDLGTAMQLTNIARDVMEDYAMGRIYLPLDWLEEEKVDLHRFSNLSQRAAIARVVRRLLQLADGYYASADRGLLALSFRPACAIASARWVYSAIGREVLRRGPAAWDTRTWIPLGKKVALVFRGIGTVLLQLPSRMLNPWRSRPITLLWRYT